MLLRMPRGRLGGALGLWPALLALLLLLLLLLAGLPGAVGAGAVPDLRCHTDFQTEVVCYWDMPNMTDCAKEFRLYSTRNAGNFLREKSECPLESRRIPESASLGCFCVIKETNFFVTKYTFLLVTKTNKSKEFTFDLNNIVKPRTLRNLTVTKTKKRSFILAWKRDYHPADFLYNKTVSYEIQILAEGQKQPDLRTVTEQTEKYEIFMDGLVSGKNYSASVRYKLELWGSFWSEWSSPCWWFNDFGPEPGDQLWWFILLACLLVMALVSAVYCCFIRLKQKWWDEIPSPDQSDTTKDLGKKQHQVPWQVFQGDEGKDSPGTWEAFLTPEVSSIEPSLTILSPVADPGPGTQVEEEEDHVLRAAALVGLFQDILWGEDSTEDADPPRLAPKEPPPAGAPGPTLGGLGLLGGTRGKGPEGPSESGCGNANVAASSQATSPATQQPQGEGRSFSPSPYKLLLFPQRLPSTPYRAILTGSICPQANGQSSSWARPPQPSCYKTFSSLAGQPPACFDLLGDHQVNFPRVSSWPPSHAEVLFFPPHQEAPSQNAPAIPDAVDSRLPGYQPFRPASQDPSRLCLGSPYKPLLEVFRSVPKEGPLEPTPRTQEAETEVWHSTPWEEPLMFACSQYTEEDSGPEGVGQGAEGLLPQMSVAPL